MPTTLNSIMAEVHEEPQRGGVVVVGGGVAPKAAAAAGFGGGGMGRGEEMEDPPTRPEVMGWYVYGLCTYFVVTFLIPVLFPLIVAQRAAEESDMPPPPGVTSIGVVCHRNVSVL